MPISRLGVLDSRLFGSLQLILNPDKGSPEGVSCCWRAVRVWRAGVSDICPTPCRSCPSNCHVLPHCCLGPYSGILHLQRGMLCMLCFPENPSSISMQSVNAWLRHSITAFRSMTYCNHGQNGLLTALTKSFSELTASWGILHHDLAIWVFYCQTSLVLCHQWCRYCHTSHISSLVSPCPFIKCINSINSCIGLHDWMW